MSQSLIFYPMATLVVLTYLVALSMLRLRVQAVQQRALSPRYFLLNRGGKVPQALTQVEQNYLNLLELPVLFYALCVALFVTGSVTPLQLGLAWGYVGLRIAHTLIHTTINNLRLRLMAFALSFFVLGTAWVVFVLGL